jgi:hypothetical protein
MIFVTPLIAYRYNVPPGIYLTLQRLVLILILPLLVARLAIAPKPHIPQGGVGIALVAFNVYLLVRLLDTPNFNVALASVLSVAIGTVIIFTLVAILDTRRAIITATKAFLAGSILPIGIGLYQVVSFYVLGHVSQLPFREFTRVKEGSHLELPAFYVGGEYQRIASTLGAPNFFGEYLGTIIVLLLALTTVVGLPHPRKRRLALIVGVPLVILLWLSTYARSAWVATIMGVLVLGYYVLHSRVRLSRQSIVTGIFVLLVLGTLVARFLPSDVLLSRATSLLDPTNKGVSTHLGMRLQAIDLFLKNPLLGVGLGGYGVYVGQVGMSIAHSQFLLELAEGGVVGFTIFLSFVSCFIFPAIHKLMTWPRQDTLYRAILLGLIGAVLLVIFNNVFLYNTLYRETNWVLFGLATAAASVKPGLKSEMDKLRVEKCV